MIRTFTAAAIMLAAITHDANAYEPPRTYPSITWVQECAIPANAKGKIDNILTCTAYLHGLINALAIWQRISPETAIVCLSDDVSTDMVRDKIMPLAKKVANSESTASVMLVQILAKAAPCHKQS